MKYKTWKCSGKPMLILILVLVTFTPFTEGRGGGGGGGRGGGSSGGGRAGPGSGRAGSASASGSGVSRTGLGPISASGNRAGRLSGLGTSGRGTRPGKSKGVGKKLAAGGLLAAGGVATYAAYKSAHKGKDPAAARGDTAQDGDGVPYLVQGSTLYSRREGAGMSAWMLIAILLGILGLGTLVWCCATICIPIWHDKQSRRNRTLSFSHIKGSDDMPLQQTPSTATPSP